MFVFQMAFEGGARQITGCPAMDIVSSNFSKQGKSMIDFLRRNYELNSNLMDYMEANSGIRFAPNYARQYLSDNLSKAMQDKANFFFKQTNSSEASHLRDNMRIGIELIAKAEAYLKQECNYDVKAERTNGAKFEEILAKSMALLRDKGIELDMKALENARTPEAFLSTMNKFQEAASLKMKGIQINTQEVEDKLNFRIALMSLNLAVITCNMVEKPQNVSFDSETGQMVIKFTDADEITSAQIMYDAFRVYSLMRKFDQSKRDYGAGLQEEKQGLPSLASKNRYSLLFSGSNYAYDAIAGKGASKEIAKFAEVLEKNYQEYMLKNQAAFAANLAGLPASAQTLFDEQKIAFWRTESELNAEKEKAKKITGRGKSA